MTDTLPTAEPTTVAVGGLRRNNLGLSHAIVISVAVMSPAASIFFNTIPQAGLVGAAIPLCYVVGFLVALVVANQYSEFSRELPSSGSAYTFVSEGLGPRWGFLTAWIGLAALALGAPYSFVLMGANLQTLISRWAGVDIPWPAYFLAAIGLVFALCYWGIRESLRIDMTFLVFELGVCIILAAIILFHVGSTTGLPVSPFTPDVVPPGGDLTVGIVLAVLSFIGFETAAALGEETRNPHRNIPRAVYGSMIVVGVFYVLMAYAATVGYGPDHMATGYAKDAAPFDTIARVFGGPVFAALIDVVGLAGFFSAALAIINGGARILYAASREGALPRWLSTTHATRGTPIAGVTLLCGIGIIAGIGLGLLMTPITAFAFFGTMDAILVLLIYVLVNIACIRFFIRKRRARFNLLRHGILPALGLLITLGIVVAAVASPGPAPLSYIPIIVAIWLALGLLLLLVTRGKLAG
ncbi:MAG TPA: APC family permease [Ktedonobacterales bacterium]